MFNKMTKSAALAVTLFGTMAPAVIASAATDTSSDVPVTYDNTDYIVTDADYVITTPAAINFDPKDPKAAIDATVDMLEVEDMETPYTGKGTATVSVTSANAFKLKHESKSEELSYNVRYDETGLLAQVSTEQEIGDFSKDMNKNVGQALLIDSAKSKGLYSDTLTYTVVDTTEEPEAPAE